MWPMYAYALLFYLCGLALIALLVCAFTVVHKRRHKGTVKAYASIYATAPSRAAKPRSTQHALDVADVECSSPKDLP